MSITCAPDVPQNHFWAGLSAQVFDTRWGTEDGEWRFEDWEVDWIERWRRFGGILRVEWRHAGAGAAKPEFRTL